VKGIRRAKRAIRKSFQVQLDNLGFSMVELLSACPTNWKVSPIEAWNWIDNKMAQVYKPGVLKDTTGYED
jgi:2-oxoglutarate ferredoxin oxidoreductase subunit beta